MASALFGAFSTGTLFMFLNKITFEKITLENLLLSGREKFRKK